MDLINNKNKNNENAFRPDNNTNNMYSEKQILEAETGDIRDILINEITLGKYCERSDGNNDLELLKASIASDGMKNDIIVEEITHNKYEVVAGSRRYLSHKELGKKTIRCKVLKNLIETERAYLALIDNRGGRKERNPVEEARIIKILVDLSEPQKEIAIKMGLPESGVTDRLNALELGDDIIQKIGCGSESPFKFTHAVALAPLRKSARSNREVEIRELMKKTITHKLSAHETKCLVNILLTGEFDQLPEKLRTEYFTNKYMTSDLAYLYFQPESIINGDSNAAEHKRQIAQNLTKDVRENHILKALKLEWTYEKAKSQLLNLIDTLAEPKNNNKNNPNQSPVESMVFILWDIKFKLDACKDRLSELAKSNPSQLESLHRANEAISASLQRFLNSIERPITEKQFKSGD